MKYAEISYEDCEGRGYSSGVEIEVVVDDVSEDVVLVKKNHKLMIHLNKKQIGDNTGDTLK